MLNHLIRTAKSHLGNAIQCEGSGGGLSGGKKNMLHSSKSFYITFVLYRASRCMTCVCLMHLLIVKC